VAPHWPRGGQSSDQDVTSTVGLEVTSTVGLDLDSGCREVMPARGTSRRATGPGWSWSFWLQINWTRSSPATEPGCRHPGGAGTVLLLRWFNKAKMTWSPPPVFRCRLVRGFEGFGQVLLLVGEQMAVSVDGDLDA
jgi:hypothetical protein